MQNRYPLWKNLLLLAVLLIGLLYALPNVFFEDPAIQISSVEDAAQINKETLSKVQNKLHADGLKYLSAITENGSILIRFKDTDVQLKARDEIKALLGEDYVVALNLATRTPKWLTHIGANPMKMGLDLRGGVHFLLEVDINGLLKAREESDIHSIVDNFRESNIRYSSITHNKPSGLVINFKDKENLDKAFSYINKHFPDYILIKNDNTDGNLYLRASFAEAAIFKISDYAIEQTMTILNNRVNELGVSEALVQRQGRNNISIDLPGIQDSARAKDILGKIATLKFQMLDTEHDVSSALAGEIPLGSRLYDYEGHPILLKEKVILQGKSITYATASYSQDGRPAVQVRLGGGGETLFNKVTAENIGKPMAVVYSETKTDEKLVDGKLVKEHRQSSKIISVATIQSALGINFEITGLKNEKYAENLALLLRSGAIEVPVSIIEELTIGPSSGKSNIQNGILSIAVGFAFVVCFMMFYYRVFGVIANVALFLNMVFIVALLSILGATLTLPGMAGIVLTVGMTVDANVLIYERIREELRNNMSPQASIYSGYSRALVAIVDANITTLIVALVLFALGSGAVKGFAVTLTIGLMTSMMTSVFFTRAIINLVYGWRAVKTLSIGFHKKKV